MKVVLISLLWALLLSQVCSYASTIFSENFEVTTGKIRTDQGNANPATGQTGIDLQAKGWTFIWCANIPCTSEILTTTSLGALPPNGSKMMAMKFTGDHCTGVNICAADTSYVYRSFSPIDEIYTAQWIRYEKVDQSLPTSHVDGHGGGSEKIDYFNPGGDATPVSLFLAFHFDPGMTDAPAFAVQRVGYTDPACGGTCLYGPNLSAKTVPYNQWVCIESHIKMNDVGASNGVLENWIDGVQTTRYTTVLIRNVATAHLKSFQYYRQGANNQWRYGDDIFGTTTRVGCTGTTGPPDTTSPTPPVISVSSPSITQATVTITTASTDAFLSGYDLRRCTGVGCTPSVLLTTLPLSPLTYTDNTVSPGQTYVYDMRGRDTSGNVSAYSATKSVTIGTGGGSTTTITFDAASNSAAANTTNSITWNHTTGSGSNRLLAVCVQARDSSAIGDTTVTGVTYGGTALTKIRSDSYTAVAGFNLHTELWNLIAPASGTNLIAVTFTGPVANYGVGSAATYTGVTQTSFNDANNGANGNDTTPTVNITTVTDGSMIVDCVLDSSNAITVGAGQTQRANRDTTANVDGTGVSETLKATAGVETMSWSAATGGWALSSASFKPGVTVSATAPTITSLALSSSAGSFNGIDITVGTAPTYVLVEVYTSTTTYSSIEYAYSAFTAGHLAFTVPDGVKDLCVFARDASHVQNNASSAYQCKPFGSLVGAIDTTAPTLSNPQPSGTLPSGTTSTSISMSISKGASCLYSASNISYTAMLAAGESAMTGVVPVVSATVSVSAGTNNFYGACRFTDINDVDHDSSTLAIPVVVAAAPASDTTRPSDVSGVTATVIGGTAVRIDFTLPTDNVALLQTEIFLSTDGTNYFLSSTVASPTHTATVTGLAPNALHYVKLQAKDTSSNVSLNFSSPVQFTTDRLIDVTPPSTMANLAVEGVFTSGATLTWTGGTDTGFGSTGSVKSTIEIALSTGGICGAYTTVFTDIATTKFTPNLTSGTAYCARGLHTDDQGNVSVDFSNVVTFTTGTTGLSMPRAGIPAASTRSTASRSNSTSRATRN